MRETKSHNKKCLDWVDEFNKSTTKYEARLLSFLFKNMSIYCESIKIKDKSILGNCVQIDCWENGLLEIRMSQHQDINIYKDIIEKFEKIAKKEVVVERY